MGLPQWLRGKESTCNAGELRDPSLIPGLGRSPGGGHGNPSKYPMDRKAWGGAIVHRVTESWTQAKVTENRTAQQTCE